MSMDELCKLVESKPELFNSFTIEQLEELEKYYDEIIAKLAEELWGI